MQYVCRKNKIMKANLTAYEAEVRMKRAWEWFWKTEPEKCDGSKNPRWETFRRIRDRLRPFRLPLTVRLECALIGLTGGKQQLSVASRAELKANIE